MNLSYFDESLSSRLYQEYSAKLHRKKLDQIKNRHNHSLSITLENKRKESSKQKSFLNVAKINEVQRENKILYDRLTLISARRLSGEKSQFKVPKTLNFSFRKKQTEKIIQENKTFIQRLIEKPPNLSVKKLELDYEMLQKYKENMSKKKILDRINKLVKDHPMPTLAEVPAKNESSPEMKRQRNSSLPSIKPQQPFAFSLENSNNNPDIEESSEENIAN